MTVAIAIKDLKYTYAQSGFTLNCPQLDLPAAKITLITGPNGSGKTTLSKLICGLLQPQQGEVRIFGAAANELSLGEIGRRVGYLFQNPAQQLVTANVWQEMIFVERLLKRDEAAAAQRAEALLERFGLAGLAKRGICRLSRGEKQRLALCTILMNGARFFILDEPTVGLDRTNRQLLYAALDELRAEGKGCAIISHEGELWDRYRDKQIRLEKGRVLP